VSDLKKLEKLLITILSAQSDSNIKFNDLRKLLLKPDFNERIKGDHYIFTKKNVLEIINIQPKGNSAKPYQVKQVRELILKYKLKLD